MRARRKSDNNVLGKCRIGALGSLFISTVFLSMPVHAQESQMATITGTLHSLTRNTMVLRADDGLYRLYTFDRTTTKPATITIGSQIRVLSFPSGDAGFRVAYVVTVLREGPAPVVAGAPPTEPAVVPLEIQNLESSIQRAARKFHLGVRGGVALDPELVIIGVHAQFGPFFSENLFFRPNVEFDWGEVTKLFGINAEMVYRLPLTSRYTAWNVYVGGGPAFNFAEQSFGHNDVNFSDFRYDAALNILVGIQYRSGLFAEMKTSVFANPSPSLRLLFGYTF
jgi:hypothetical protein